MAKKRANGEGSIYKRKSDNRWTSSISIGFCERTGKRRKKAVYAKTQAEVAQKLDELKQQKKRSLKSVIGKDTVDGYLQRWLEDIRVNRSASTHNEYEVVVRLHIIPFIGTKKLTRLNGEDLCAWQNKLVKLGLSADVRSRSIRVLRAALNKAVKLQSISFNPVHVLDKPKLSRREVVPLEFAQCRTLFEACSAHRLGDMIVLAALTGLRKGELLGLEWKDVNLPERVLVVRRSLEQLNMRLKAPKTAAGKRTLPLGKVAVEALRSRLQKAENEGYGPDVTQVVFPNVKGKLLRGVVFDQNCWYPIREAAGIADTFVFHDLRHTQASLLLAAGVPMKVIQQRLGHSNFNTTANTYAHLLQDAQNDAVEKVDSMFDSLAPKSQSVEC